MRGIYVMNTIKETTFNVNKDDIKINDKNNSNDSSKNFLDYIISPDISDKDLKLQEELIEVLEELRTDNEENLYDSLVNNLVESYTDDNIEKIPEIEAIEKIADVADELGYINWIKL